MKDQIQPYTDVHGRISVIILIGNKPTASWDSPLRLLAWKILSLNFVSAVVAVNLYKENLYKIKYQRLG